MSKHSDIRDFLDLVEWAHPENLDYLLNGESHWKTAHKCYIEMYKMTKEGMIKRLPLTGRPQKADTAIFASLKSKKYDKGISKLDHDIMLRNVIALLLRSHQLENVQCHYYGPDAQFEINGTLYYLELDRGHEDEAYLRKKIETHYTKDESYRVIFIMHNRPGERPETRLTKLFKISRDVLKGKSGRIIGATYTGFLENGKILNSKGEKCEFY